MKNTRTTLAALLLLGVSSLLHAATTINSANHYAYGANLGWLDWRGDTANGAVIGDYVCSGSIYSANTGWINLGGGSPTNGIRYLNLSASDFGVNHDGAGNLRGYAYGANIGWVNFENTGAPKVDLVSDNLSGYVWSANCGWISLSNAVAYVQTDSTQLGAQAQNLIINGSFEDTSGTFVNNGFGYMPLTVGSTTIPGWTVYNDQIAWLLSGGQSYGSTPFGSFFLDLTGTHDNGSFGGVYQMITTTPSNTYTLSASIGVNQDDVNGHGIKQISVSAGSTTQLFTFYPSGTGMQWTTMSFNFVATSSSTLISIVGTQAGPGYQALFIDNVSVFPPPTLTFAPATPGQVTISWAPATPGFVLQESLSLSPASWVNSPSGVTNPITVSATLPTKFYRLLYP